MATAQITWIWLAAAFVLGVATAALQLLLPYAAQFTTDTDRGRIIGTLTSGLMLGIMLARPAARHLLGQLLLGDVLKVRGKGRYLIVEDEEFDAIEIEKNGRSDQQSKAGQRSEVGETATALRMERNVLKYHLDERLTTSRRG